MILQTILALMENLLAIDSHSTLFLGKNYEIAEMVALPERASVETISSSVSMIDYVAHNRNQPHGLLLSCRRSLISVSEPDQVGTSSIQRIGVVRRAY